MAREATRPPRRPIDGSARAARMRVIRTTRKSYYRILEAVTMSSSTFPTITYDAVVALSSKTI
jgi:hypothetical protein